MKNIDEMTEIEFFRLYKASITGTDEDIHSEINLMIDRGHMIDDITPIRQDGNYMQAKQGVAVVMSTEWYTGDILGEILPPEF
jgi:L-fucose mutarotase/ribose pyranase (RbsD/FucU family)